MRIAMMCTDLGIRIPDDSKGAAIHFLAVANGFQRHGHDVLAIGVASHEPPPSQFSTYLTPHPGRAEGIERERRKLAFVEQTAVTAEAPIDSFGTDAIYERLSLFGTAGRRLAHHFGVPHLLEVNALLAREEAAWRGLHLTSLAQEREREVLEGADMCIAVSNELKEMILDVAPQAQVTVVPNGVATDRFMVREDRAVAREALALPQDAVVVTFVGSLRAWHGLDIAIAALRDLPENVRLAVAGDGPERARLAAVADALGVGARVIWLGQRPHDQIPRVLAASDVAIAPYPPLEGFAFSPLKLFEYLAAGVPVVASDLGQVRTALDNGALGILVRPGDSAALATGITEALTEPAHARAARARILALREHSWDARVATIESEIEQAIYRREAHVVA